MPSFARSHRVLPCCAFGFAAVFLTVFPTSCRSEEPSAAELPKGMVLQAPVIPENVTGASRALQGKLSGEISPQENAAVWLVHVYGADAFDSALREPTLQMLGIKQMSPASPLFVSIAEYVQSLEDVSVEEEPLKSAELEEQLVQGGEEIWNSKDKPLLAGYLEANGNALEMLTVASNCPGYFAPLLSDEEPQRLLTASLVIERRLPFLARLLATRALLRFQDQDMAGCLSDLMTCHRLAYLLASGSPQDVSVAKAHVIDSFAFRSEGILLGTGQLTAGQLELFRKAYAKLSPLPPDSIAADQGERAIIHQEIELLKTDPDSAAGFFESPNHAPGDLDQAKSLAKCQWDLAIQQADEVQDKIVNALATQDRDAQNKLFLQLDQEYEEWDKTVDDKTDHFSEEIQEDLPGMSRWVGESMAMSLRPGYRQRRNTEDRANVRRDLISVGLALEVYQREQGAFPETLKELAPKYLKTVPLDACTDKEFVYTRNAPDQASLIGLGNNRADDAGKLYSDDVILQLR